MSEKLYVVLMVFLVVMIGETVPTFASSVDASLGQLTVHITNGFYYNEKPLVMHCWSEDDDLGEHTLWKDNEFHFSFRESFIGWTHFYCEMHHDKQFKKIDVYDSAKEYIKCTYTLNCYWMVDEGGFFFSRNNKLWYKIYDW